MFSWGSFFPPACWLAKELVGSRGGLAGVRRVCGRNVEKKFLEGGVATLTGRWLVTRSLRWRGERGREAEREREKMKWQSLGKLVLIGKLWLC